MSKFPSQMQEKFNLRFPDGMRDAIAERAKQNGRSMNSEIIKILQDAIDSGNEKLETPMTATRFLEQQESMLREQLALIKKLASEEKPTNDSNKKATRCGG